jgi:hypothetical protein
MTLVDDPFVGADPTEFDIAFTPAVDSLSDTDFDVQVDGSPATFAGGGSITTADSGLTYTVATDSGIDSSGGEEVTIELLEASIPARHFFKTGGNLLVVQEAP